MEGHKSYERILPIVAAGIMTMSSVEAQAKHHDKTLESKVQQHKKEKYFKKESHEGRRIDDLAHPIAAEACKEILRSPNFTQQQIEQMEQLFVEAGEEVKRNRFNNEDAEKKYFKASRDFEKWNALLKQLRIASEKTGIPLRIIVGVGFLESQFENSAHRRDTKVFGPFQMTLDAARIAAQDARKVFGKTILVTPTTLSNPEIASKLHALRVRQLKNQYGQLGIALIGYASGESPMRKKIKEVFPGVDFGDVESHAMEHFRQKEIGLRKAFREMKKHPHLHGAQHVKELTRLIREADEAAKEFLKMKKIYDLKKANIPESLRVNGVNVASLIERLKAKGKVQHSVMYPLMVDYMADRAYVHAEKTKKK